MRTSIDILSEPYNETYHSLIRFIAKYASTFSFAWLHDPRKDNPISSLWGKLQISLTSTEHKSEWPGTRLSKETRLISFHQLTELSLAVLLSASSLYSWIGERRPEDLAFYTKEGECIFGSISHEQDAFINADIVPFEIVHSTLPGLNIKARRIG